MVRWTYIPLLVCSNLLTIPGRKKTTQKTHKTMFFCFFLLGGIFINLTEWITINKTVFVALFVVLLKSFAVAYKSCEQTWTRVKLKLWWKSWRPQLSQTAITPWRKAVCQLTELKWMWSSHVVVCLPPPFFFLNVTSLKTSKLSQVEANKMNLITLDY